MHYILTGFRQDAGFRVFSFQRVEQGQTSTDLTIRADLALAQKYEIRLQELPLLCRGFLEQTQMGTEEGLMTYTEEAMRLHQGRCAEDLKIAQLRKKAIRRPIPTPVNHTSPHWRSETANRTQPFVLAQPVVEELK